jgi:gas vesicle protein
MHERHAVYRLESSSGWKLQPPVGQNEILLGPTVGLRRAEYHPEPVAGELGQQIQQTRRDAEVAYSSTEALKSRLDELNQRLDENVSRENRNQQVIVDEIKQLKQKLEESHLPASPSTTP